MQQRYYDPVVGRFLSRDPMGVDAGTGGNFNRYWYANNNPYRFTDPDGRIACVAAPPAPVCLALASKVAAALGGATATKVTVGAAVATGVVTAGAAVAHQAGEAGADTPETPALPGELVGEDPTPRGSGNSVTSGKLKPELGGNGDFEHDLGLLAGETRPAGPGDKAPPNAQVGQNGVFGRPNSKGGNSIDIPANGEKPHEVLHYPKESQ